MGEMAIFIVAQPVFAPSSGLYDFSFTYESSRYEQDCFMTIDVLDNNNWITLYQSPTDIEGNSEHLQGLHVPRTFLRRERRWSLEYGMT